MREDGGISWQDAEASTEREERLRPPQRTIWERSSYPAGLGGSVLAHAVVVSLALFGGQIFRADSAGEGTVASVSILTPAEYGALISNAPAVGDLESEPLPAADLSLEFPGGQPAELAASRGSPTLSELPVEPAAPTGNEPPQWVSSASAPVEQASNQPSIARPPVRSSTEAVTPEAEAAKPVVSAAESAVGPNEPLPLAVPQATLPQDPSNRESIEAREHSIQPSQAVAPPPATVDPAVGPLPVSPRGTQGGFPVVQEPVSRNQPDASVADGPDFSLPQVTAELDTNVVPTVPLRPPDVTPPTDGSWTRSDLAPHALPPSIGAAGETEPDGLAATVVAAAPLPVDDPATQPRPLVVRDAPVRPRPVPEARDDGRPGDGLTAGPDSAFPQEVDEPGADSVPSLPLLPPSVAQSSDSGREVFDLAAQLPPNVGTAADIERAETDDARASSTPSPVDDRASQLPPVVLRDAPDVPESGSRDQPDASLASGPELSSPRSPDEPDRGSVASLPLRPPPGTVGRDGIDLEAQPPPAINSAAEIGQDEDRPTLLAAVSPTVNDPANQPLPLVSRDAPEVPRSAPGTRSQNQPDADLTNGVGPQSPTNQGSVPSLPLRPPTDDPGREGVGVATRLPPPPGVASVGDIERASIGDALEATADDPVEAQDSPQIVEAARPQVESPVLEPEPERDTPVSIDVAALPPVPRTLPDTGGEEDQESAGESSAGAAPPAPRPGGQLPVQENPGNTGQALDFLAGAVQNLPQDGGLGVPVPGQGQGSRLSGSELEYLTARISDCWRPLPLVGQAGARELVVTIRIQLSLDGYVNGEPELVDPVPLPRGNTAYRVAFDLARAAVRGCAPYDRLPKEKYHRWQQIEVSFNPEGMVAQR